LVLVRAAPRIAALANSAHTGSSGPDYGLGFLVKVLKPLKVVPSSLGDGLRVGRGAARADDAQGTPTQSHISPSILEYEEKS